MFRSPHSCSCGLKHNAVLKTDPTRTGLITRRWIREVDRRFAQLKKAIWESVVDQDALGLEDQPKVLAEEGGVWRTINGTPVFIKDGQSVGDAIKERFGKKDKSGEGGGAELDETGLKTKYEKLLPKDHPGITFVNVLPSESGFIAYARTNLNSGKIEVSRQTPPNERELSIAHEVGHEVTSELTNKVGSYIHGVTEEDGSRSVEVDEDAPPVQKKLIEFWQSVDKAGVSEYGDSFREQTDKMGWSWNRDLLQENLSEAFAAIKVGGSHLDKAIERNSKAMELAQDIFKSTKLEAPKRFRHNESLPRKAFRFRRNPEKVKGFMDWLDDQTDQGLLEVTYSKTGRKVSGDSEWQKVYIDSAYKKSLRESAKKAQLVQRFKRDRKGRKVRQESIPESVVESSFLSPVHADAAAMSYTRAFQDLKNVTEAMETGISRSLAQGLLDGKGPHAIAREMMNVVDGIGRTRARMIARTEVVWAHNEAALNVYEEAGLEGVRVQVEWSTAGFNVCPDCAELQGRIFTIEEARQIHPPLHPNCFIDGQIRIYTSKGWKCIKDVKVGDQVLTHKMRFKKVTQIHKTPGQKPNVVRIHLNSSKAKNLKPLTVTEEHPIRAKGKWVLAKDVKQGMFIRYFGDVCPVCGSKMPFVRKYCSNSCRAFATATGQWSRPEHRKNIAEKNKISMLEQYRSGVRDADKAYAAAHAVTNAMYAKGVGPFQLPRVREIIRKVTNRPWHRRRSSLRMQRDNPMFNAETVQKVTEAREAFLKEHPERRGNVVLAQRGFMSSLERKMKDLLDKLGIAYKQQYPIGRYFVDFAIPALRIAIECDGEYWHKKSGMKDLIRQRKIEKRGWTVIRFTGTQINKALNEVEDEVLRVVSNHSGAFTSLGVKVNKVERWSLKAARTLWNLSVEGDESFIANGFVVHNCRCAFLPAGVGEAEETRGQFDEDSIGDQYKNKDGEYKSKGLFGQKADFRKPRRKIRQTA